VLTDFHAGHAHTQHALSRRGLLKGAAGAALAGAAVGSGLFDSLTAHAAAPGIGLVEPIPATIEFFPGVFRHVQAPPFTGLDSDPGTVYNFEGAAGLAYISGEVDRTNRRTGETRTLPFLFSDMRIQQGVFKGRDGHVREATFAFV
jgi:hypothetical protein